MDMVTTITTAPRRTIERAQKLEWGKLAHEEAHGGIAATAKVVGVSDSQLRTYRSLYRLDAGLPDDTSDKHSIERAKKIDAPRKPRKNASKDPKKIADRERSAARRAALKEARQTARQPAPAASTALVPAELPRQLIEKYEARIAELETQNAWLQSQCDILNKLLMTVGTTL